MKKEKVTKIFGGGVFYEVWETKCRNFATII